MSAHDAASEGSASPHVQTAEAATNDVLAAASHLLERHGEFAAARALDRCRFGRAAEAGHLSAGMPSWAPDEPDQVHDDGERRVAWVSTGAMLRAAEAYLVDLGTLSP